MQAKLTSSSINDLRVSIRLPRSDGSGEKLSYGRISRSGKTSKSSKKEDQMLYTYPIGIYFQKLLYFFDLISLVSTY